MMLPPLKFSSPLWPYGLAVALVAAATALTLLLNQLPDHDSFALFYVAIAVVTWQGGLRAGLLAVFLSALACHYFFLPPTLSMVVTLPELVRLGVFLLVALLISSLVGARTQAEAKAEARARQAEEAQNLLQTLHDETERVRERLERILAGIKDDFVMYDHDWRYVYVNESAAQTLGYPKEQLVGQRIWDLFPNAVGNDFYQKIHQAVAENREIRFEFYYEPFDQWFENRAYPIADGLLLFTADITERKRVEEKLRQSEERMRLAIEANRMLAWDWDPVTDRVNTSQNVADIYGLSAVTEAAEGFAMIWPDDLPAHQEKVARITREGGEYQSQFRITRPIDGRTVWIEERASALTDAEGRVTRLVGVVTDITERKRWEAEREQLLQHVAAEYERLETILQQTPAGIVIAAAPSGESVLVNEHARQLTGFDFATSVEIERYQEIQNFQGLHPNDRPYQPEEWPLSRAVRRGEQVVNEEIELCRADGSRIIVQANASPICNAEGQIVAGVTAFVDITAQKQAEQALRQSEEGFRALANAIPSMVWTAAPDGTITYANEKWFNFVGITPEGNARGWPEMVLHPDDYERCVQAWTTALATGPAVYEIEVRNRRYDGEYRWFLTRAVPTRDAEGRITGWYGVTTDLHDRKQVEEAERQAHAEAEIAGERLSLLASASEVLIASPDYETSLANLAQFVVPSLADWCVIDVIGRDGLIRRLAVVHRDLAKAALAAELQQRYPALDRQGEDTITKTLRGGQAWLDPAVSPERLAAEARDETHLWLLQGLGFASEMVVPLIARGHNLGALTFVRVTAERGYGPEDLTLAQEIARRAAIAVDNARLYEAEQQARQAAEESAEQIASLQAVTARLSQAVTPLEIMQIVFNYGITASGAEASTFGLLTDAGDEFVIVDAQGHAAEVIDSWRRFPVAAKTPMGDVVRSGQPLFVRSGEEAAALYPEVMATGTSNYLAWAVLPLLGEKKAIGAISIAFTETREFTAQEREFLGTLARQCSQALERAQLYEAEQKLRQGAEANHLRLARLQMVTAALSEALTPVQVAEITVQASTLLFDAPFGAVSFLNAEGSSLELAYAVGYLEETIGRLRSMPLSLDSPATEVVREGQPLWFESKEALVSRYPHLVSLRPDQYEALALLPLLTQDRRLGLLLLTFLEPRHFSPEDQDLLWIIARQCAQALERARLYEIEQQARREAEANQQRLALLAEMRERNRLAQELHDTVAQALGYLNLKVGITLTSLNPNRLDTAKANLQELKQVINETYTDVREEIFNLRAKTEAGLGFMDMLHRYHNKYQRFYNMDIQLVEEAELALFDFPPEVAAQVIRTIQEALINVRKHAQVNTAFIRLRQKNGQPYISIEDEGRGFNLTEAQGKLTSFGLQIMRERVESVGGSLEIKSAPGQGTQVVLRLKPE